MREKKETVSLFKTLPQVHTSILAYLVAATPCSGSCQKVFIKELAVSVFRFLAKRN